MRDDYIAAQLPAHDETFSASKCTLRHSFNTISSIKAVKMLFVVVLLSMLGTSRAQVNPQGPTINLEAVFLAGSTGYVQNTAANEFTTTDSVDSAAVFIADQDTGYLFQPTTDSINFPSGYSVPAVRTLGVVGLYEVSSYDAQTVVDGIGNGYYPLTCTGGLDLLSLVDLSVPVVCTDDGLTNLVTLFGTCPTLGNTIVDYGAVGLVQFLAQCGLLDDGQVMSVLFHFFT